MIKIENLSKTYEKKNIFVGNDILPISRTYYKTFLQDLLTYWKGRKE